MPDPALEYEPYGTVAKRWGMDPRRLLEYAYEARLKLVARPMWKTIDPDGRRTHQRPAVRHVDLEFGHVAELLGNSRTDLGAHGHVTLNEVYVAREEAERFAKHEGVAPLPTDDSEYLRDAWRVFDTSHPYHAPKLAVAVKAWLAAYVFAKPDGSKKAKGHIQQACQRQGIPLPEGTPGAEILRICAPDVEKPGPNPRSDTTDHDSSRVHPTD